MTDDIATLTPEQLRRRIAEAKGWRYWLEQRGDYRLAVSCPPGAREPWKKRQTPDPERYEECDWTTAHQTGFFTADSAPDWPNDDAAAMGLMREAGLVVQPFRPVDKPQTWLAYVNETCDEFEDTDLRIAICRAWLAWHRAKEDGDA
jgi:hypothetical protein